MAFNSPIALMLKDVSEFHSERFKRLIYTHLTYLRTYYKNQVVTATPHQGLVWRGDLHGLLRVLNISPRLFWVVSIVNGFDDPCDYDGTHLTFVVPSERDINLLNARDSHTDSEPR